jgi:hypothetical protein
MKINVFGNHTFSWRLLNDSNAEVTMWVAVTSMGFGAAIGLNVFALWLTDRFGQLQKTDEELREGGWAISAY